MTIQSANTCILTTALALALVGVGCADPFGERDIGPGDGSVDVGVLCNDPSGDEDGDGIPDGEEGCLNGLDSDGDKIPDWQDVDSDGDGIYDDIEKGERDGAGKCKGAVAPKNGWPCDTDGDGAPDYLDVDSDDDGLLDGEEDENGDGLLGCCLASCKGPGAKQTACALTEDGCGAGQACEGGACTPAAHFDCSNGETDPGQKDTFGDGKLDHERGTFICRDATEDDPKGRKPVQLRQSKEGDWRVALEKSARYGGLKLSGAGPKEAAGVIDEDGSQAEVAGFVLSRDTLKDSVQDELAEILQAIGNKPPGGPGTVSQRASGVQVKSHDRYDSIQGTILDLGLTSPADVSTVRNELVGTLLGRSLSEMGNLPGSFGSSHTELVIRLVTVKRVAFKKDAKGSLETDAKGYPVDSGDKSKWRLVIMGAVAAKSHYQDPARATGLLVDDLSNGTALARASDKVFDECDVGTVTGLPVADIIWVVDESGSMIDNRQDIVNNANNFFSRALASGLDFRMGVTNVCNPYGSYKHFVGKFCAFDRFLLPSEQALFSSCVQNPPGSEADSEFGLVNAKEAVIGHLPRAAGNLTRIRPDAKVVIIVATDEVPNSLFAAIGYTGALSCMLDAAAQTKVDQALQPYLDLFQGLIDPEAAAVLHVIGGTCQSSCNALVAHGYKDLAQKLGGQVGDVCQKNLGNTLQIIIDSIVADASPIKLEYVPISSSLAVAVDGREVTRSRANGFDYRSAANSLVFINVKQKKGSEVVASYKRWQQAIVLQ
jgi:hypothetical protein